MTASTTLDAHGAHVGKFARAVPNFGRLGEMTEATLDIFRSGHWREYRDGFGAYHFLPGEFDYFLALHSVEARDVQRLYLKPEARAELAGAMDRARKDQKYRRSFDAVMAAHPHSAERLRDHWERYGWGGRSTPVGQRALQRARTGMTYEQQARQARVRRLRAQRNGWRTRVDQILESVRAFKRDELVALIEALEQLARTRGVTEWRQDAEALDWSVAACAKHWGVEKNTAKTRLRRLRQSGE